MGPGLLADAVPQPARRRRPQGLLAITSPAPTTSESAAERAWGRPGVPQLRIQASAAPNRMDP